MSTGWGKTVRPLPHPEDCDCARCEDDRRRDLRRSGFRVPGLGPKNEDALADRYGDNL